LFLHGGLCNIEEFNPILPQLENSFRIIGIDSRGQGKSTLGTGELTYAQLQKDVERVLDHLSIENVVIIGFSDGGIVGLRLAASSSLRIEKLVVIGTDWNSKNLDAVREIFLRISGESWRKKFPDSYNTYQRLNPEPNFDVAVERVVAMWLDESAASYPNEAVKNITCPLLIVRGDDDHLLPLSAAVELAQQVKNSHLLNIPFAGHSAFEDEPEIFLRSLNTFLNRD
jgi:pimeloyl-ACP methyl ester carboxylesterase